MRNTIIEAIENRNILEFDYDGNHRVVEPHAVGVSSTGKEQLRAFQFDGQSDRVQVPDWGMFSLNKIQNLQVKQETFEGERQGYRRGDRHLNPIFAEL